MSVFIFCLGTRIIAQMPGKKENAVSTSLVSKLCITKDFYLNSQLVYTLRKKLAS